MIVLTSPILVALLGAILLSASMQYALEGKWQFNAMLKEVYTWKPL